MTYPTPDAAPLALRVKAALDGTEPVHQHRTRGLDHGAWVPLEIMYPFTDVAVLQLSGAATDPGGAVETTIDGFRFGLSKRSFQVG